jgi:hypothetical protein
LIVLPRPLLAALFAVGYRYLTCFPGNTHGAARCASQVLGRAAQAFVRGAARLRRRYLIVVHRRLLEAPPVCASQPLGRAAQADARGDARCASQVLDRGA